MSDHPGFSITQDPHNPTAVVIGLVPLEWEHLEDLDEVLLGLYPQVLAAGQYELLNERTLDKLRTLISDVLLQMWREGTIYRGHLVKGTYPAHGLGNWVLKAGEERRYAARRNGLAAVGYKFKE